MGVKAGLKDYSIKTKLQIVIKDYQSTDTTASMDHPTSSKIMETKYC